MGRGFLGGRRGLYSVRTQTWMVFVRAGVCFRVGPIHAESAGPPFAFESPWFSPLPCGTEVAHLNSCELTGGEKEERMLWTIFVILLVLWLLGMVSSYTLGGFIHILLVVALVVLIFNLLAGRRTVL